MPNCPQCSAELDPDGPVGLCPRCLIQGAFDTSLGIEEASTRTIDTGSATRGEDDFGRYQILRPLGEGGMGTVYLAEQREPIRRRVALKVIKLGMDTSQVLARFANERQALAVMDHPNIARIFDAGTTPKGRPYFVMEYIEGVAVTQYCDRNRVTIGQRLELFLEVCRAVQHAHQKGVIHRDLKPSNVLVKEQEGAPLPKVIDFGIAKATDQWSVENTLLTQFGQMVGTPEYASPEQADVVTGAVDETSDVYSLGVLLYELLIGTVPFDGASMRRAGLGEMLRIIREEQAQPLPHKLNAMGMAAAEVAAHRQTDPAALRRLVEGDLNWITLKALEKVRERRYASAAELAADIQRYLEHRPVLASPPGVLYRARTFLRRHRPAVFGTSDRVITGSPARPDSLPKPVPGKKLPIVLGEFANTTGDPMFDGTLRQMMAVELGKSSHLSVLSDTRVRETLRLMARPPDAKLTPELASEICERTGSSAVLESSIACLGKQFVLNLRARNCQTGDVLHEEQASATKKEDIFKALGQMAERFQSRAGESLGRAETEAGLPSTVINVTTPSLEAWRSHKAAWTAVLRGSKHTEAVSLARRAVDIDPGFAMAYAFMGRSYDALGEAELAAENIRQAYELRDRVSDLENFFITFNYFRQVPRNLELARQVLESWTQKYPGDLMPHGFFAGFISPGTGRYEKAVEEGLKALEIDPNYSLGYGNVAFAYLNQDRVREAEALLRKASERKIESIEFSLVRYLIAFLRNDDAAMDREVTQRRTKLQAQGWFEHQEALSLAYHGRLKDAARLSESAVRLARQGGLRERPAQFAGARAVWSALYGVPGEGERNAAAASSLYRGRDADYGPGFALALLQHSHQARMIAAELDERFPEDTSVQFSYLPALRGLDALNRGDPMTALEMTQVAAPYDLAVPGTAFWAGASFFGALYPVYVRGLAYFRLGHYAEAAAELQKIPDHPGITLNDPIGPIARLQLARALAASGDRAKSRACYQDLLSIWKDADSDLPVVQEARAEAAKQP